MKLGPQDIPAHNENNFDFLRLMAALMVVFGHNTLYTLLPRISFFSHVPQIRFGCTGVLIFFVISGYLIAGSWDRHRNALEFLMARVLRIVPGLIMVALFTILIIGPSLMACR